MARGVTAARLAAALFCVLAFSAEAWARTENLHWTHAQPSTVSGFVVYWTPTGGATTAVNVYAASPDATGYDAAVNVSDGVNVTFQVSAYNTDGVEGDRSNAICRNASSQACGTTTTPPPPTGGGGPTTPMAAIAGFKLWNATTDQVLVSNFTGGTIVNTCTSIEILGNAYLAGGSGSIKKQLCTGTTCPQTACGQPGVSYENSPPFAWEDDAGVGNFTCAASLQTNGTYTLQVTPYDGKDCSGTQGTPMTVNFQVSLPGAPTTGALGVPGTPYLVQ